MPKIDPAEAARIAAEYRVLVPKGLQVTVVPPGASGLVDMTPREDMQSKWRIATRRTRIKRAAKAC